MSNDYGDKKANVQVGAQIATALGVGYLALRDRAQAAPEDLSGLMAKADVIIAGLEAVVEAIQSISFEGGLGYPTNTDGLQLFVIPFPAINTAVWLPEFVVPDGFALALKANPGNAGMIYIAPSAAEAVNPNQAWPLMPNEAVTLNINNTKLLYASATALPVIGTDLLHGILEARRR